MKFQNLKGKKKSVDNITGRDEIGVKISNFKIMHKILLDLGYIKIFELRKYRTEYRINNEVTFDIDEYVGLPPILEIEAGTYDKVQDYVDTLGYDETNMGRVYIREILAARKKYNHQKKLEKESLAEVVDSVDAVDSEEEAD